MRLILVATGVGLLIGLFGTPFLIRLLRRHGYAQAIRDGADGYPVPAHEGKRGTPSMGGVVLVVGSVLGYTAGHVYTWHGPSATGLCVLFLMTGLAAVGFADDYIKIFKQRSHRAAGQRPSSSGRRWCRSRSRRWRCTSRTTTG